MGTSVGVTMLGLLVLITSLLELSVSASSSPNIVFILADDLGYDDVSWHNPEVLSPNLERLAREGIILENSYTMPVCSPTRAALLSGYYPIHTGRQHSVIHSSAPTGLDAKLTLLPQYLKELNYSTHMIGKWHLGFCNEAYLPLNRGFDTFYGFYCGGGDHYAHSIPDQVDPVPGYDFYDQETIDQSANGTYSSYLFAERAAKIIKEQENAENPMFLYLALHNVHMPLQVPEKYEEPFPHIHPIRRHYLGMVNAMDEAVGNVTAALEASGMIDNTIIVFSTDNGGWIPFGARNSPLKGQKTTLWEGGTRGVAFIYGDVLKHRAGTTSDALIHVTDWLPTLLHAAGGSTDNLGNIDGVNQWGTLLGASEPARDTMVYNIDPINNNAAIRMGDFKLIIGDPAANINMTRKEDRPRILFNLKDDPYEELDVSENFPDTVLLLEDLMNVYEESMVAPDYPDRDPASAPSLWNGTWSTGWCTLP